MTLCLCKMCKQLEIEVKPEEMGDICPECKEGVLNFLGALYMKADAGRSAFHVRDTVYAFTEEGKKLLWNRLKMGEFHEEIVEKK